MLSLSWENYEMYLGVPQYYGGVGNEHELYSGTAEESEKENESLRLKICNRIRRYPLRSIKRPNYCEMDDSDDDTPEEKISRRYSVGSALTSVSKGQNNTDRKKVSRRRYSESIADTVTQDVLLDNPDFHIKGSRENIEKKKITNSGASRVKNRAKSVDTLLVSVSEPVKKSRKRNSDTNVAYVNEISPRRQKTKDDLKNVNKDPENVTPGNILSNYQKYEQLYLMKRGKSCERVYSDSKKISHRRKSTGNISSENSNNIILKKVPVSIPLKKNSYKRKSESVREMETSQEINVYSKKVRNPKDTVYSRKEKEGKKYLGTGKENNHNASQEYKKSTTSQSSNTPNECIVKDKYLEKVTNSKIKEYSKRKHSDRREKSYEKYPSHSESKEVVTSAKLKDSISVNNSEKKVEVSQNKKLKSEVVKRKSSKELVQPNSKYNEYAKHDLDFDKKKKTEKRASSSENQRNHSKKVENATSYENKETSKKTKKLDDANNLKINFPHLKETGKSSEHIVTTSSQVFSEKHSEAITQNTNSRKPVNIDKKCKKDQTSHKPKTKNSEHKRSTKKKKEFISSVHPREDINVGYEETDRNKEVQVNKVVITGYQLLNPEHKQKSHKSKSENGSKNRKNVETMMVEFKEYSKSNSLSRDKKERHREAESTSENTPEKKNVTPYEHCVTSMVDNNNNTENNASNCSYETMSEREERIIIEEINDIQRHIPGYLNEETPIDPQSKEKSKGESENISSEKDKAISVLPSSKKIIHRRKSEGVESKENNFIKYFPNEIRQHNLYGDKTLRLSENHASGILNQQIAKFKRRHRRYSDPSIPTYLTEYNSDQNNISESTTDWMAMISRHQLVTENYIKSKDPHSEKTKSHELIKDSNQATNCFSPETLMRRMFTDEKEAEASRRELIQILTASSEDSCDDSDTPVSCNAAPNKNHQVKDTNVNMQRKEGCSGIIIIESKENDDSLEEHRTDENTQSENMTKMEHYKKRLIHQHEKPALLLSPYPTTEEEDDSPSTSPISSSSSVQSNIIQEKRKEEIIQSKVAKKKSVSRKQYRHKNLELFKLGTSIPTSLCKTKEPYNICAEKNLQMCCQSPQNGKKESSSSITAAIINSIEGGKKRDAILWRSISLNTERVDKQRVSHFNNNNVQEGNNKNTGNGRHILPAIVPEIPDRRKSKVSSTISGEEETKDGYEKVADPDLNTIIHKAEPVSINKRKNITQRRKTVIGIENSNEIQEYREDNAVQEYRENNTVQEYRENNTVQEYRENNTVQEYRENNTVQECRENNIGRIEEYRERNEIIELYREDTHTSPKRRNSSTDLNLSQSSPINLSVKRTVQNGSQPVHVNRNNSYKDPRLSSTSKYRNYYQKQNIPHQANEPQRNILSLVPQSPKPANYGMPATRNNSYYQSVTGFSFPEIQQQIMRMEDPNAPVPFPNHTPLRQEFHRQHPMNPCVDNNEEVIKTIIQLVKSSMDPNFSIEILLILNKWYIELKLYSVQPMISKSLKLSIAQSLNAVVLYISEKLFGSSNSVKLKCYVEEMLQILLVQHKELLTSLLPLLKINCHNHQWMCNFIKLLSHSPITLSAESPMSSRNINEFQMRATNTANKRVPQDQIVGLAVGEQRSVPSHSVQRLYPPPEQYFTNYPKNTRPPPPYEGFHFKDSLTNPPSEQILSNMNRHHANGSVGVQNKYLDRQRGNPQFQGLYPNTPYNYQRPEHYNVPSPSKLVRSNRLYHADNRCVPPKFEPKSNPHTHVHTTNNTHTTSNRPNTVPNRQSITSANLVPANDVPGSSLESSVNHKNVNRKPKDTTQINSENPLVSHPATPNMEISRHDSETSTSSSTISEQYTAPDVEELLQTNVIFNKNITTANNRDTQSVPKANENNIVSENVKIKSRESNNVEKRNNENTVNDTATDVEEQNVLNRSSEDIGRPIHSTVIVQDNSMEITRGNSTRNLAHVKVIVDKHRPNSNEIIVERIRYIKNCEDSTSSPTPITHGSLTGDLGLDFDVIKVVQQRVELNDNDQSRETPTSDGNNAYDLYYELVGSPKKGTKTHGKEFVPIGDDEEVSVEDGKEMPKPKEVLPKLIKLPPMKRKENDQGKAQQEKKQKKDATLNKLRDCEVVVIDDEKDEVTKDDKPSDVSNNSDCNQNYITKHDPIVTDHTTSTATRRELSHLATDSNAMSSTPKTVVAKQIENTVIEISDSPIRENPPVPMTAPRPIIEDISSDEESLEPFHLYNTYDSKVCGDPKKILENTEVSHCTLIEGNIKLIESAVHHQVLEKSLVYTKPVTPQQVRRCSGEQEKNAADHVYSTHPVNKSKKLGLAEAAQFREDCTSLACHLKVRNTSDLEYPSSASLEESFSSTSNLVEESRYPRTPPANAPNIRYASNLKSPNGTVPISPIVPIQQVVPNSPAVSVTSIVSNNSKANWNDWINDEQRKGFFNFTRSLSTDSGSLNGRRSIETTSSAGDQCANCPVDANYFEIKIDSKVYTIKKSLYERIPKGKLCYIRETNTFIRYFDDKQMELFIHNLNVNEGSHVASDLLKQIKGRADGFSDVDVSLGHYETSSKSEIITLPKDVHFTSEDYLSDPESYVEEVEKVERFVPKDFYGFYKFVTGYQIVNHHPPISFQTFLTMHNTNGIRGLFKNYINTLIEGRNVL